MDIIQTTDDLEKSLNSILEGVSSIVIIMIIAAVILAVVVLYNLGMMSFIERFRELSTLKVLGFRDGKVNYLLISENSFLTLIGLIIGIPLGVLFTKGMVALMPENMDIPLYVEGFDLLVGVIIILITSFLVSLLICLKTKTLNMVESLKQID